MNQSSGNQDGDLAIVYTPIERPLLYSERFIKVAFPETVIIPELENFNDWMFDCSITFGNDEFDNTHSSKGDFSFNVSVEEDWETGEIIGYYGSVYIYLYGTTVRYSCDSNNPSIWNRTQLTKPNPLILDEYLHVVTDIGPYGWQDYLGRFINVSTIQFNGLYKYNGLNWEFAETNLNAKNYDVACTKFYGNNGMEEGTLQNKTNINTLEELQHKVKVYQNISNLDLSSNFTNLNGLLYSMSDITKLPNINTCNVENMAYMCYNCVNLTDIPVFNTSKVTNMWYIFDKCNNISSLSYHNIADSLPLAENLSNHQIRSLGLNFNKFTNEDKQLLGQKGYVEAIPLILNTSNVSTFWNISYE